MYVASIPVSCAARLMVSTSQRGTRLEPNETVSVRLSPRRAGFRGSARGPTLPAVSNAAASAAAAQLSLSIRTPTPSVEHALGGSAGQPRSAEACKDLRSLEYLSLRGCKLANQCLFTRIRC